MAIQAAAIVARKTALSIKRRAAGAAQKTARHARGATAGRTDKVSWIEVLFVSAVAFLANDLPDMANITVVAQLVTVPIDIISAFIVGLWFWWRAGDKPVKSGIKNGATFFAEVMPFVGIFPFWMLSVLNVKLKWFDWLFNLPVKLLSMIGL